MTENKITGNKGEDLATIWLAEKGYTIIERNWRYRFWEVDIIASKGKLLHFFEVKTRTTQRFGHPEESIGNDKMKSLKRAAEEYLYQHSEWKYLQFDVLAITILHNQPPEYFLIEDIFF
jgi:putative endonuclease